MASPNVALVAAAEVHGHVERREHVQLAGSSPCTGRRPCRRRRRSGRASSRAGRPSAGCRRERPGATGRRALTSRTGPRGSRTAAAGRGRPGPRDPAGAGSSLTPPRSYPVVSFTLTVTSAPSGTPKNWPRIGRPGLPSSPVSPVPSMSICWYSLPPTWWAANVGSGSDTRRRRWFSSLSSTSLLACATVTRLPPQRRARGRASSATFAASVSDSSWPRRGAGRRRRAPSRAASSRASAGGGRCAASSPTCTGLRRAVRFADFASRTSATLVRRLHEPLRQLARVLDERVEALGPWPRRAATRRGSRHHSRTATESTPMEAGEDGDPAHLSTLTPLQSPVQ